MTQPKTEAEQAVVHSDDWAAGVGALQREMLTFVADRLQKDSRTIRETLASASLGDALTIQSQWMAETVHDYMTESAKVMSLMTDQASAFPQFGPPGDAEAPAGQDPA